MRPQRRPQPPRAPQVCKVQPHDLARDERCWTHRASLNIHRSKQRQTPLAHPMSLVAYIHYVHPNAR